MFRVRLSSEVNLFCLSRRCQVSCCGFHNTVHTSRIDCVTRPRARYFSHVVAARMVYLHNGSLRCRGCPSNDHVSRVCETTASVCFLSSSIWIYNIIITTPPLQTSVAGRASRTRTQATTVLPASAARWPCFRFGVQPAWWSRLQRRVICTQPEEKHLH